MMGMGTLQKHLPFSSIILITGYLALVVSLETSAQTIIDLEQSPHITTIHGQSDFHNLGYLVKAGDFNADGRNDFLLTGMDWLSLGNTDDYGYGVLLYGRNTWPREIDLDDGEYDVFIQGGSNNQFLGTGAYFMDINHDEADDLILGDPAYDYPSRDESGTVYAILGQPENACDGWRFH